MNVAFSFENVRNTPKTEIQTEHTEMLRMLRSNEFRFAQDSFDIQLRSQAKFLRNFMHMFEELLLFIRATRQSLWELHLASLQNLAKYFFAFDLQNYARFTPVYLSQMYELETINPTSWSFLRKNFTVNKTRIPFSAIGPDHAIEHENRALKVIGGIKGIANKPSILNTYFLAHPEMKKILSEFNSIFGIESVEQNEEHYELTERAKIRLADDVRKLRQVFQCHETSFDDDEQVYNIVTKTVLEKKFADRFLQFKEVGEQIFQKFVDDRLLGEMSIWQPLPKSKIPTFSMNCKSENFRLQDRVITLKEDHRLLMRFVMISRERPEINLESYLGQYEFSVVPRSMFSRDGTMHLSTDKASIIHEIEKICWDNDPVPSHKDLKTHRVIIRLSRNTFLFENPLLSVSKSCECIYKTYLSSKNVFRYSARGR